MLYVKAKITWAEGTNLAVDSPIGPSNLFLHSLFSQVDVSLNGTFITASTNTYPYRAMMETLMSYGEDAKRTQERRLRLWSMNTEEIDRILRRQCTRDFDGVFNVDTLPDRPRLLVCNTDPSYRPGRHWVAICVKDGRGEYFDSFGRRPSGEFKRYMNRHCRYWTFNDKQLQSVVSQFCEYYCICYCLYRSNGIDCERLCVVLQVTLLSTMYWYMHWCVEFEKK